MARGKWYLWRVCPESSPFTSPTSSALTVLSDDTTHGNYSPCVKLSFPHCRHWKIALWFMSCSLCLQNWELFATLFGRLGIGPKLVFTVTRLYAWRTRLVCLVLWLLSRQQLSYVFATSEKPGSISSVPPAWSSPFGSPHNSLPGCLQSATLHVCSVMWHLGTERPAAFQNLIVDDCILAFYSPWVLITKRQRSWFTRDRPGLCLLSCIINY